MRNVRRKAQRTDAKRRTGQGNHSRAGRAETRSAQRGRSRGASAPHGPGLDVRNLGHEDRGAAAPTVRVGEREAARDSPSSFRRADCNNDPDCDCGGGCWSEGAPLLMTGRPRGLSARRPIVWKFAGKDGMHPWCAQQRTRIRSEAANGPGEGARENLARSSGVLSFFGRGTESEDGRSANTAGVLHINRF